MSNALDVFTDAIKQTHDLNIPDKPIIEAMMRSAMRTASHALMQVSVEGFDEALDTLDKVKAVEDYIKKKRKQSKSDLSTQNLVAAHRLRIVREIGRWLGKYLANAGRPTEIVNPDSQLFWLHDLDITRHQSSDWQLAASIPDDKFEAWIAEFLRIAEENEAELYLARLLEYIRPGIENAIFDSLNLSPHMRAVYVIAWSGVGALQKMMEEIKKGTTARREIEIVTGQLGDLQKEIDKSLEGLRGG